MRRWQAAALLVLTNVLWGSAWPVAKLATAELPAPLLAGYRITVAAGLFWLIWWRRRAKAELAAARPIERGAAARIVALGLCSLGLSYLLTYQGVALTRASDGALMIIGEVIFTALLARWLGREPVDRMKLAGIALGSLGVVVLVLNGVVEPGDTGGGARMVGDLLVLGGLFLQALYSVLGAEFTRRHAPITVIALAYSGALAL